MTQLFGRTVVVQLDDVSYTCGGRSGLRAAFDITRTLRKNPNKAKVEIYNLSQDTAVASLIRKRDLRVRILAGYGTPKLKFQGNPTKNGIVLDKKAPDRILRIQAQDGLRRYQTAKVRISLTEEVTFNEIVEQAIEGMGLPRGVIEIPGDSRFTQGFTYSGSAQELLGRLAESLGCDFSIQNGRLEFLPRTRTRTQQGPEFSTELGNLIDAPRPKDRGIQIRTLLAEDLNPGDRFLVAGQAYKCVTIRDLGDSGYANDFYSIIDGVPS